MDLQIEAILDNSDLSASAVVFPGQGSQKAGMLNDLEQQLSKAEIGIVQSVLSAA